MFCIVRYNTFAFCRDLHFVLDDFRMLGGDVRSVPKLFFSVQGESGSEVKTFCKIQC